MSMASRVVLVAVLAAAALGAGTGSAANVRPSPVPAIYTVRSDPRLCPSPLCGGYWVALANGARTWCSDGVQRSRCYIAEARGATLFDGGLAKGTINSADYGGLGKLGVLVVSAVFAPAGAAAVTGGYYRIVDTGIRCVRAPCFSYRATQVNGMTRTTMSGVDLEAAWAKPTEVERAQTALYTKNGLLARGRFVRTPDGGRVFKASRLFPRVPQPHA
jgi:hypothetical protein